jgi:WD40 repeat protein
MKTNISLNGRRAIRVLHVALILGAAFLALPKRASAQLYVSQYGTGVVSEYDVNTGKVINANFITGLTEPWALLLSGDDLFVANGAGYVGKYDAKTGAAISQSFITGESGFYPTGLALSGGDLFVADSDHEVVGKYDAKTGATINASFLTFVGGGVGNMGLGALGDHLFLALDTSLNGLAEYNAGTGQLIHAADVLADYGLAFLSEKLFVVNASSQAIDVYDAKTLKVIHANFITGLTPHQMAVLGDTLFMARTAINTVGKYNARTGAVINASFISGLSTPIGVAVKAER